MCGALRADVSGTKGRSFSDAGDRTLSNKRSFSGRFLNMLGLIQYHQQKCTLVAEIFD